MATFEHNSATFGYINLDDLAGTQEALGKLGFDAGKADGKDGPKTQGAVRAFQAHALIGIDGKVGDETRGALVSELEKRASESEAAGA